MLFEVKVAGKPLTTALNIGLQQLAERTLANTKPASALVVIRPSTGCNRCRRDGRGNRDDLLATVGRAAPGPLSRSSRISPCELIPLWSTLRCSPTVTVDGRKFSNYSELSTYQGTITLRTALAQSCNTAFIGQRGKLDPSSLAEAAGSLGFGIDYDVGFPSFFGSVPNDPTATGRRRAFGQGKVEASPMAMAAVAASVAAGKTVIPHLVDGQQPTPKGEPLTAQEARQLGEMMQAVDPGQRPGARQPPGPPVLAKTGTAEYGIGAAEDPPG